MAEYFPLQGECPKGKGVEPHLLRVSKQPQGECPQGEGVDQLEKMLLASSGNIIMVSYNPTLFPCPVYLYNWFRAIINENSLLIKKYPYANKIFLSLKCLLNL
jgi:hypothetical protein